MRTTGVVFALLLSVSGSAFAQEWTDYQNTQDGFKILFIGQPKVTETTWKSQAGFALPERVYSVEKGRERYSVSVVDYTGVEQMGIERVKSCPPGSETCLGSGLAGVGYWKHDIRGALLYALFTYVQRNAKVTDLLWNQQDLVEGIEAQLTSNVDQSRTYVYIGMHENKLYLVEGTVPKGSPEPGLFTQSMGWVDKDGNGIRYQTMYSNQIHGLREAPVPPHGGRGGAGAGPAAGGGRGQGGGGGRRGGGAGGAGNAPQQ